MTPLRILVADAHPLYRDGLVRLVQARSDLELAGVAASGSEALAEVERLSPDVAVLDAQMPDVDARALLAGVTRDDLQTEVVLLSAHVDSGIVYAAVAAGVKGLLAKDADAGEIGEAIAAVARGETVLAPAVQSALAAHVQQRAELPTTSALSDREREVLRLIAEGRSAPEIAGQLHLSTGTVKGHLHTLYDKLGVSDRAAAVAVAMRRGLVD